MKRSSVELKSARDRYKDRAQQLSHQAKKSLGQNFLVSDHVIQKIIDAVKECKEKNLIEIGPGLGALTDYLVMNHANYTAIEMDHDLSEYWKNQGLSVIEGDALKIDWSNLTGRLLVSNLPYQISSSIVIDRCLYPYHIGAMILMFQKEVAQRIRAKEKTEAYGMLSVIAQEFWDIETVCDAGPKDFDPPPKIASRVLKFKIRKSEIIDRSEYLQFVKSCFQQRRRILKSNLPSTMTEKLMKWIELNKISDKVRVEELSPSQIRNLYFFIKKVE
jgi:16S rRNA (adenine1518-N6/adenine1519-N6)-dimethyltransferase